jgi:hypothetical protein
MNDKDFIKYLEGVRQTLNSEAAATHADAQDEGRRKLTEEASTAVATLLHWVTAGEKVRQRIAKESAGETRH